jgi:hypothetical protein
MYVRGEGEQNKTNYFRILLPLLTCLMNKLGANRG